MNLPQPHASSSKTPAGKPPTIPLTPDVIARFKASKIFRDALDKSAIQPISQGTGLNGSSTTSTSSTLPQITSLAFDDVGERCLTAGEDEGFVLWDAKQGRKLKNFWSKKYGVSLVRFTHRSGNILHASTKLDDHAVRYHSTHDNKYLSYFRGHTGKVRSLHLNPTDDTFLTSGDDGTVRMWDLRSPSAKGVLNDVGGSAIAGFDNTGKVFAVACSATQTISLYDTHTMDSIPFHHVPLIDPLLADISQPPPKPQFTSVAFSNNGLYLLIGTSLDAHYLLDAFELSLLRRLVGHKSLGRSSGEEVSFSADSRYVISGSADGGVHVWDLGTGKLETESLNDQRYLFAKQTVDADIVVKAGEGEAMGPSRAIRFNPRYAMLAVGGEHLSLWMPMKNEDEKMEEGW